MKIYIKSLNLVVWTSKASNILKLSKMIIEIHNGKVPKNFEELEQLPGVDIKQLQW